MRGLLAGQGKFDIFHVGLYYGHWIKSRPFTIGVTTSAGLWPLSECLENPNPNLSYEAARDGPGAESMSNGSLMRATPLAVWTHNLNEEELQDCVQADVALMHSQKAMWDL